MARFACLLLLSFHIAQRGRSVKPGNLIFASCPGGNGDLFKHVALL